MTSIQNSVLDSASSAEVTDAISTSAKASVTASGFIYSVWIFWSAKVSEWESKSYLGLFWFEFEICNVTQGTATVEGTYEGTSATDTSTLSSLTNNSEVCCCSLFEFFGY
jgi:hypothetical protein